MSRVIHFEIPASDPERAANFYRKAFGWKIEKWPGPMDYWMVNTGAEGAPGINGGLMKNTQVKTTTNTIGVDSVDAAVKTVQSAGGKLIMPNPHGGLFRVSRGYRRKSFRRNASRQECKINS